MNKVDELLSLLLAIKHHMDGSEEDKKFAHACIDKCILLIKEENK